MPRTAWTRSLALAAATMAFAACGSDATAPGAAVSDTEVSLDVAAQTADAVSNDVAAFTEFETTAGLNGSAAIGCPISAGRHRCASETSSGLTTTRTFAYFDGSGATMAAYDSLLTASLDVQTTLTGTRSGVGADGVFASRITRTVQETLSGLAGRETQRTWNGSATGGDTTVFTGSNIARTYSATVLDTTTNVVVQLPRSTNPYPISGRRVRVVNAKLVTSGRRSDTRQVARRVVVTFNGTSTVPMSVDGVSCTLHLDTHQVEGCAQAK